MVEKKGLEVIPEIKKQVESEMKPKVSFQTSKNFFPRYKSTQVRTKNYYLHKGAKFPKDQSYLTMDLSKYSQMLPANTKKKKSVLNAYCSQPRHTEP